jgi:hypothetical protein
MAQLGPVKKLFKLPMKKRMLQTKFIYKNGSKTEKAGLHLYTKYHEAVMLQKMFTIDH